MAQFGMGRIPSTEALLTIDPPPDFWMAGIWCLRHRATPPTLIARVRWMMSAVTCVIGPPSRWTPALLKAKSSLPNFSSVVATRFSMSASSAISVRTNKPLPPACSMSAIDSAPSLSRRPATTTFAPCAANAMAVARPMPAVPPVTMMTLPECVSIKVVNQERANASRSALS